MSICEVNIGWNQQWKRAGGRLSDAGQNPNEQVQKCLSCKVEWRVETKFLKGVQIGLGNLNCVAGETTSCKRWYITKQRKRLCN